MCLLEEDDRRELFQQYMATCTGVLAKLAAQYCGNEWTMPSYYEMTHPEEKPKDDRRTGEQIRQDLIKKLTGGD